MSIFNSYFDKQMVSTQAFHAGPWDHDVMARFFWCQDVPGKM